MLPDFRVVTIAVVSTFLFSVSVGFLMSSRLVSERKPRPESLSAIEENPLNRIALNWPEPVQPSQNPLELDFAVTAKALRNPVRDVTQEVASASAPEPKVAAAPRATVQNALPAPVIAAPQVAAAPDTAKEEIPKIEAPKVTPAKQEPAKAEAPKPEAPSLVEAPRPSAPKPEAPRVEDQKPEPLALAPGPEAAKLDVARIDAPKPDVAKPDAPTLDAIKPDAPKPDAFKPEAPKPDAPKLEARKIDVPVAEVSKIEIPKIEASQPESKVESRPEVKPDAARAETPPVATIPAQPAPSAPPAAQSRPDQEVPTASIVNAPNPKPRPDIPANEVVQTEPKAVPGEPDARIASRPDPDAPEARPEQEDMLTGAPTIKKKAAKPPKKAKKKAVRKTVRPVLRYRARPVANPASSSGAFPLFGLR